MNLINDEEFDFLCERFSVKATSNILSVSHRSKFAFACWLPSDNVPLFWSRDYDLGLGNLSSGKLHIT